MPLALALALSLGQQPLDPESLNRTVAVESAAIERTPDDREALYRLGLAYLALKQPQKAIKPLTQLLQADPEAIDGTILLARAHQQSGDIDKAKSLLDAALERAPDEPSLFAERGQLARASLDLTGAVAAYRKAVALAPDDPSLLFNLGEALQAGRHLDDAITIYKKAIALKSDFTQARVNLGKALADKGLFGQAKEVLGQVNKDSLDDPEAHYNLGVIYMREGAIGQATTEFERTLAIDPKHAEALNNLGVAWDARGDTKRALSLFKKASAANPTFAESHFNAGMSYLRLNQPQLATKAFEQALKLEPGSSGPYVQLGTLYLKQGKKDRAVEAFKMALSASEDEEKKAQGFLQLRKLSTVRRTTDAYRGLALAYLSLGQADEAVATLKRAVDKMPQDASARLALGEAYVAQNQYDEAIAQFKERLALEPTLAAKLDLARAYAQKRAGKEAERLYREILQTDPNLREAKLGLVDLYLMMGRYAEAESDLKALLASDGQDLQALSRLGLLKSRLGRPNEAMEPLEKASTLNPLLFDARAEYAFLLFRGDPSQATRCISTMADILTSEPRHVLSLHYLGVCLYAKGNTSKAKEMLQSAIKVDPSFAAAHFSLGELYENAGQMDAARQAYETAAKLNHPEASSALKRLAKEAPRP